jgi:hypothetical protein
MHEHCPICCPRTLYVGDQYEGKDASTKGTNKIDGHLELWDSVGVDVVYQGAATVLNAFAFECIRTLRGRIQDEPVCA